MMTRWQRATNVFMSVLLLTGAMALPNVGGNQAAMAATPGEVRTQQQVLSSDEQLSDNVKSSFNRATGVTTLTRTKNTFATYRELTQKYQQTGSTVRQEVQDQPIYETRYQDQVSTKKELITSYRNARRPVAQSSKVAVTKYRDAVKTGTRQQLVTKTRQVPYTAYRTGTRYETRYRPAYATKTRTTAYTAYRTETRYETRYRPVYRTAAYQVPYTTYRTETRYETRYRPAYRTVAYQVASTSYRWETRAQQQAYWANGYRWETRYRYQWRWQARTAYRWVTRWVYVPGRWFGYWSRGWQYPGCRWGWRYNWYYGGS